MSKLFNTRWKKVSGDLRENPWRALLAIAAIFIGTLALATAMGARSILTREVSSSFAGTRPAAVTLWLDAVSPEMVQGAARLPHVTGAEARRLVRARAEVAPNNWQALRVFGVADFQNQRVSRFSLERGQWPQKVGEVVVERSALPVLKREIGSALRVRAPGGTQATLRVVGIVHDAGLAPGWQDHVGYVYAASPTLALLGQGDLLDELRLSTDGDRAGAETVAREAGQWLQRQGQTVQRVEVPVLKHPHADHMAAMLALLSVFSGLALLLSGALTANVLAALLGRQVREIGVMKAIGATSRQIRSLYLVFVAMLTGAGVALGIPLGTGAAHAFASFAATQLNLDVTNWDVPLPIFALEAGFGLGVPLLFALFPILRASRLSAREAIQFVGMEAPAPTRFSRLSFASNRPLALAFRNTFRRPGRLALTLAALSLGGAALLTAANVSGSLTRALDQSLARRGDDVDVRLLRPAPSAQLVSTVERVPGVRFAEGWGYTLASLELSGQGGQLLGTGRYPLLSPPEKTRLWRVPLLQGRWPRPDEANALVINRTLRDTEKGVSLGADIVLIVAGRRTPVHVVGVVEEVADSALYANGATMNAILGATGEAGALRIVTEPGQSGAVAAALEEVLADNNWFPTLIFTRETFRASMLEHFMILIACLSAAALSAIVVGGLGLGTHMSLSVLERAREIGVLRAIGAPRRAILRLLWMEGAAIAALSVIGAVLLSWPLSALLGRIVGDMGPHVALPLLIVPGAIGVWLVLAAVVTGIACYWPAQGALRRPVREVLAHE